MKTNSFPKKPDFPTVMHRIVCVFGGLLNVYFLLLCIASFRGALQDLLKFSGLGFSDSLSYYLIQNSFPQAILMFLSVSADYLLYRRIQKHSRGSICYFSIVLILHAFLWLHAHSLFLPDMPPYSAADEAGLRYRFYANTTILPSAAYFLMHLLHMRKGRSKT